MTIISPKAAALQIAIEMPSEDKPRTALKGRHPDAQCRTAALRARNHQRHLVGRPEVRAAERREQMRGAELGSVGCALLEDFGLIDVTPDPEHKDRGATADSEQHPPGHGFRQHPVKRGIDDGGSAPVRSLGLPLSARRLVGLIQGTT